jgi:hypothetical protein
LKLKMMMMQHAYLLADNRTTDLASYDDAELANLLKRVSKTDEGLIGTAFDGDDLDDLLSKLNTELKLDSTKPIDVDSWTFQNKCPKCGFEFDEQQQ